MSEYLTQHIWLTSILTFVIGLCTMPFVLHIAKKKHFVVRPNKRTSHTGEIPNIGGVNIFFSLILMYLICCLNSTQESHFLLFGLIAIFIVGFVDDLVILSPLSKLLSELLAGVALIAFADIRLTHLHGLFSVDELSPVPSYLISFVVLAVIINAFNLIDGIDGLASGLGIIYCLFFAVWFGMVHETTWALLATSLIGGLGVFFCYNVFGGSRTKIFMGDSGSLLVGYMLTAFTFRFCELNGYQTVPADLLIPAAPGTIVCIFGIPLFDTARVSMARIRNHRSPFLADKNHIHHLLLNLGFSHIQTTCILLSVTALLTAIGIIGRNWNMLIPATIALALYTLLVLIIRRTPPCKKEILQPTGNQQESNT